MKNRARIFAVVIVILLASVVTRSQLKDFKPVTEAMLLTRIPPTG